MIVDAINRIINLSNIKTEKINGSIYADRVLHRIPEELKAETLQLNTLSGLVEYIKHNIHELCEYMLVVVSDPCHVSLYSQLNADRTRECLIEVKANVPHIDFDRWISTSEEFNIMLQSQFLSNEDRELLLKFAGNIKAGSVTEYGDDGVTQKAVVKTGVTNLSEAIIPNPVQLRPFRTFPEVEQPESGFIFRVKNLNDDQVACALFEADGGAWKLKAIDNIKRYLDNELREIEGISILA